MNRLSMNPAELDANARAMIRDLDRTRPRASRTDHDRFTVAALHFGPACAARLFPGLGPNPNAIAAQEGAKA